MTHILKRLAAAACMTLTLGIAFAGQPLKIESITYEPQANVNGEQLLLNGAGLRTKIFFKVYTAGLYLKAAARRNTEVMAQNSAARVRLGLLCYATSPARASSTRSTTASRRTSSLPRKRRFPPDLRPCAAS